MKGRTYRSDSSGVPVSQCAIAYYRVSTQRQGRSGFGLEAQRAAVARFAEAEGITILQEVTEVETGKRADALDRWPQLSAALASRKSQGRQLAVRLALHRRQQRAAR
ncbi:recombinase family protein [Mesorhizobium sp. YM1C-6-2]|uniref:recombinase family protein n=1 Tax=Mesorhizobium sp. YM1C-6-2 TaxID=1827501 RepID=UPI000EF18474|nr:recombinase family protein [Mesorhizobium sp. YM1C-6-2]RLP22126.1 hypothetical protein D8676_25695 [Mesorhizobium sp. YM1C-6-2]